MPKRSLAGRWPPDMAYRAFKGRWLDLVASIYIYNEHRGYMALDRVLEAVRCHAPDDHAFIRAIEQHRADERKHYLMFKRWWERRGTMPFTVDRTCGHIDRFVEIMFRSRIDDLDAEALIERAGNFEKLCRVISLTERRGYRQIEILLRHPFVRGDRTLMKIFRMIKVDEPRHWAPYEEWLKARGMREPSWWERVIDQFIHSELLVLKLPILFLTTRLRRRTRWADEAEHRSHNALATDANEQAEAAPRFDARAGFMRAEHSPVESAWRHNPLSIMTTSMRAERLRRRACRAAAQGKGR